MVRAFWLEPLSISNVSFKYTGSENPSRCNSVIFSSALLRSVIRLDMVQYNNIRNNIQFLSYKMGETPEESIIHAGLEKDLWNVILNHYPQISILQIKALAIYYQTTINILVNTFMLSGLNKKLKILREEKIPNKLQFICYGN